MCLVDVADDDRRDRLVARDLGRWDASAVAAFLGWAAWHRGHAHDPRHLPEAVMSGSAPEMAWNRWTGWAATDPRWRTHVLDTTGLPLPRAVDQVEAWIGEQREAHRSGALPLARGWADTA